MQAKRKEGNLAASIIKNIIPLFINAILPTNKSYHSRVCQQKEINGKIKDRSGHLPITARSYCIGCQYYYINIYAGNYILI